MSLIVFEDEHLLVVDKPAGWNTHAPSPYAGEGVFDWLKHREPRWATLAIVHRLDKETSGLLVFGKTPLANKSLTDQFTTRVVRKKYLLVTDREPKRGTFRVVSALVRSGDRYLARTPHAGADTAETRFRVVERRDRLTTIEAEPVTGRTHQIRVHAAAEGIPILGDGLYGGRPAERVFLHAAELSFRHPKTGVELTFRAPPPWKGTKLESRGIPAFIDAAETTAWRVIHGGSGGWYVDRLGDWLLAQSETGGAPLGSQRVAELRGLAERLGARGAYHKELKRQVRGARGEASPQLVFGEAAPEFITILENGLTFELSFQEGYSVGLFLDQRDNRRRLLANYVAAGFPLFANGAGEAKVLNTFAYTCGFSVAAAKAGATVTSLDLSRKYLACGKRNFHANQLDPERHDFIYGDAFDWLRRLTKKERKFDAIVLDPPTFSQSKESGTWQAERSYGVLMEAALPLLKRGGVLLASTNAARLDPEEFVSTVSSAIERSGRRTVQRHYVPQPPDFPITRAEPAYLKTIWLRVD